MARSKRNKIGKWMLKLRQRFLTFEHDSVPDQNKCQRTNIEDKTCWSSSWSNWWVQKYIFVQFWKHEGRKIQGRANGLARKQVRHRYVLCVLNTCTTDHDHCAFNVEQNIHGKEHNCTDCIGSHTGGGVQRQFEKHQQGYHCHFSPILNIFWLDCSKDLEGNVGLLFTSRDKKEVKKWDLCNILLDSLLTTFLQIFF